MARRLADAVPHTQTRTLAKLIDVPPGGDLVVELGRVRVRVPRSTLVSPTLPPSGEQVLLDLPCHRPRLSSGFLLVDGSHGNGFANSRDVLRLYVHVPDPDQAVRLWQGMLTHLEAGRTPYRAKTIATPTLLPRWDGLVVYLPFAERHVVFGLAALIDQLAGAGAESSPFARRLGRGVAVAWSPDDKRPGRVGMSFGEQRSMAVADGLLAYALGKFTTREEAVAEALREGNVDPRHPFRNLTSPLLD